MAFRENLEAAIPTTPNPKRRGILSRILSALPDVLASGAEGYAQGAGDSNIPEAAAARGFSEQFRRGRENKQGDKIRNVIEAYKKTPQYSTLGEEEKTQFELAPLDFLSKRQSAKKRTTIKLSQVNPEIAPELDREIEVDEEDLPRIFKKQDALPPEIVALLYSRLGLPAPKDPLRPKDVAPLVAVEGLDERKRAAREMEGDKRQKDMDTQTTKFSKTIEDLGIPEAITQFKTVMAELPPLGVDIPGVGVGDSLKFDWMVGKKGRAIRQSVAGLQNIKIKDRSGAAVTPQEFVRLADEFGSGKFKTEEQFRQGLQSALNTYRERLRNAFAGVRPDIRDQYFQNQDIDDYLSTLEGFDFGGTGPASSGPKKIGRFEVVAE